MKHDWLGRGNVNLERMVQMERRLGLPDTSDGIYSGVLLRAHAVRRCAFCPAGAECEDYLAGGQACDSPPGFCPNAGYFALIRDTLLREGAET